MADDKNNGNLPSIDCGEKAELDAKAILHGKFRAHLDAHLDWADITIETSAIAAQLIAEGFTTPEKISGLESTDVRMFDLSPRIPVL